MPIKPNVELTASTPDIVNSINEEAGLQGVPQVVEGDLRSLQSAGAMITANEGNKNAFLSNLFNRIAKELISSGTYNNPLSMFKMGILDLGESIEEIFVNLVTPIRFDPETSKDRVFQRTIPDVRTQLHILNYEMQYPQTISEYQLRTAFVSWDGLYGLVGAIVEAIVKSANYDEYLVMKYLLQKAVVSDTISQYAMADTDNKTLAIALRMLSDDFTFLKTDYNTSKVYDSSSKDSQYLMIDSVTEATLDVEVLASAFNVDKADFMGKRVLIDNFDTTDDGRMVTLIKDFVPFTTEEKAKLKKVKGVLIDKGWFRVYDNLVNSSTILSPNGLYTNFFYTVFKTLSTSNFKNAVAIMTP